jgi:hypothetical protein
VDDETPHQQLTSRRIKEIPIKLQSLLFSFSSNLMPLKKKPRMLRMSRIYYQING